MDLQALMTAQKWMEFRMPAMFQGSGPSEVVTEHQWAQSHTDWMAKVGDVHRINWLGRMTRAKANLVADQNQYLYVANL